VQAAGNHEMKHEPEIAFQANCNPLSDAAQFAHTPSFGVGERRSNGAQNKWAQDAHLLECLADYSRLERD
jgi:hypothetical protein